MLQKFQANQISRESMTMIVGGQMSTCDKCKLSATISCPAAGNPVGSANYDTCVNNIDTACSAQSYCNQS